MTEHFSILAAVLMSMQAQPAATEAASAQPAAETAAKSEKAANDDDKIICRRTAIIGSKFKKRICGTKKQWETLANRGSDTTREMQRAGKGLEPGDVPGI